jgi:hypothetical protein
MKKYLSIGLLCLLFACHSSKKAAQPKPSPTPTPPTTQQPAKPTKADLHRQIIEDSKPGGGLDFFTPIQGHESEEVEVKPGVMSTRLGVALYHWGKSCASLGVKSATEALEIWAAFKGRAANAQEKEQIALGFRRGWD